MFSFFKKKPTPDFPEEIVIERVEPSDDEILEEWKRICTHDHQDMHVVYASKWKDGDFEWDVTFSAGELIREEPFVSIMNELIINAITSIKSVKEAHHEDTEKYVVSGEVEGEELVRRVSSAIDEFAKEHLANWQSQMKQK